MPKTKHNTGSATEGDDDARRPASIELHAICALAHADSDRVRRVVCFQYCFHCTVRAQPLNQVLQASQGSSSRNARAATGAKSNSKPLLTKLLRRAVLGGTSLWKTEDMTSLSKFCGG